jgi:hypothetical protein
MIEFIFTLDYEVYGNGQGALEKLVWQPAEELRAVFQRWKAPCVVFVEAAELEVIERHAADSYIGRVKEQLKGFYHAGWEIALHLHPQWYGAKLENGAWHLEYAEYNLCTLSRQRIEEMVDRGIAYLQGVVGDTRFSPVSFRAGNWLFQPTQTAAAVLVDRGFRVDSSVFKGGVQHDKGLDYRAARKNGHFWRFASDVAVEDPRGTMLELPIYTRMVPFWNMLTSRRVGLQRRSASGRHGSQGSAGRLKDYLRPLYPLKMDFCRMTTDEMCRMLDEAARKDGESSTSYLPLVAIGHTKDQCDLKAVEWLFRELSAREIPVSRLDQVSSRCDSDGSGHVRE